MSEFWKNASFPLGRDAWDLYGADFLHLFVLSFGPGKPYAASASIPKPFDKGPYTMGTDFVFATRREAMMHAEALGNQLRERVATERGK